MTFNWMDYIDLSEKLLEGSKESYFRSSISRTYHGVLCIARNWKGYRYHSTPNHDVVIKKYKNSTDTNEQEIGQILDKLRKSRVEADYNENKSIDKAIAERAVKSAKEILSIMDSSRHKG
ncbi:MAG: HEPN domain-containing protein [Nitrospirota bacterium]